jgi:hypothetical protein
VESCLEIFQVQISIEHICETLIFKYIGILCVAGTPRGGGAETPRGVQILGI